VVVLVSLTTLGNSFPTARHQIPKSPVSASQAIGFIIGSE